VIFPRYFLGISLIVIVHLIAIEARVDF
jgi:hypothetical protein